MKDAKEAAALDALVDAPEALLAEAVAEFALAVALLAAAVAELAALPALVAAVVVDPNVVSIASAKSPEGIPPHGVTCFGYLQCICCINVSLSRSVCASRRCT